VVDLLLLLAEAVENPFIYFLLVFVYAILIAIILPIPIETALLLPIQRGSLVLFTVALFAVALGKAVGAWLVFLLGVKVEGSITKWSNRWKWFAKFVEYLERFVRWSGTLGLYTLLSIPLMSDTLPIYFYALFNKEGKALDRRQFILSNFLAWFNRVALLFILAVTLIPGLIQIP